MDGWREAEKECEMKRQRSAAEGRSEGGQIEWGRGGVEESEEQGGGGVK